MFFQLLFIHLFRPFLKYTQATSPLPQNVSPRKLCTQAAMMISKLMRLYKRSHGLRQICNIAAYIAHSACTIHLLNLPDRNAKRDIVHGVKHLEEIAEGWLCARRSLVILSHLAAKWNVELPEEAAAVLARTDTKFADYRSEVPSQGTRSSPTMLHQTPLVSMQSPALNGYFTAAQMPALATGPSAAAGAAAAAPNTIAPATTASYLLPRPPVSSENMAPPLPSATTAGPITTTTNNNNNNALQSQPQAFPSQPATTQQPPTTAARRNTFAGSPLDMFGGIEQLLHDSNNWVYRDQAQLANGFENWTTVDLESPLWPTVAPPPAAPRSSGPLALDSSAFNVAMNPAYSASASSNGGPNADGGVGGVLEDMSFA